MGNKMDHVSTSKLRHALDLSIADPADKDAEEHGATSAIQVRKARAMVEEIIESESATVEHRYEPPRVSWVQRVLSWFSRR